MSALVRSGWVAANSIAIVAARAPPNTIAAADPAASITAPTSSRCSSSTGGSDPRSESPTPPHVEQDQSRELRQTLKEVGPSRLLPHQLDVRPDTARVDEVDRSVADHLVRDGGSIRRLRVAGLGGLHGRIFGSRASGPQPASPAPDLRTITAY